VNHNSLYKFYKADISDLELIDSIIQKESVSYIINFAAESHVVRSIDNPSICCDTNIFGTQTLLNVARKNKIKTFIQISTDEVYGSLNTFNWKPKIKFEKGLELTIKWYLDHQDWLDNVISKEYLKYYEKLYGNR